MIKECPNVSELSSFPNFHKGVNGAKTQKSRLIEEAAKLERLEHFEMFALWTYDDLEWT